MMEMGCPNSTCVKLVSLISRPSTKITNRNPLSIAPNTETYVYAEFGNKGYNPIEKVRVVCNWNDKIRFTGKADPGPFKAFQPVIPNGFQNLPSLFYPSQSQPNYLVDLKPNQYYKVALGIKVEADAYYKGSAGRVKCYVLDSYNKPIAESQELQVTVK